MAQKSAPLFMGRSSPSQTRSQNFPAIHCSVASCEFQGGAVMLWSGGDGHGQCSPQATLGYARGFYRRPSASKSRGTQLNMVYYFSIVLNYASSREVSLSLIALELPY